MPNFRINTNGIDEGMASYVKGIIQKVITDEALMDKLSKRVSNITISFAYLDSTKQEGLAYTNPASGNILINLNYFQKIPLENPDSKYGYGFLLGDSNKEYGYKLGFATIIHELDHIAFPNLTNHGLDPRKLSADAKIQYYTAELPFHRQVLIDEYRIMGLDAQHDIYEPASYDEAITFLMQHGPNNGPVGGFPWIGIAQNSTASLLDKTLPIWRFMPPAAKATDYDFSHLDKIPSKNILYINDSPAITATGTQKDIGMIRDVGNEQPNIDDLFFQDGSTRSYTDKDGHVSLEFGRNIQDFSLSDVVAHIDTLPGQKIVIDQSQLDAYSVDSMGNIHMISSAFDYSKWLDEVIKIHALAPNVGYSDLLQNSLDSFNSDLGGNFVVKYALLDSNGNSDYHSQVIDLAPGTSADVFADGFQSDIQLIQPTNFVKIANIHAYGFTSISDFTLPEGSHLEYTNNTSEYSLVVDSSYGWFNSNTSGKILKLIYTDPIKGLEQELNIPVPTSINVPLELKNVAPIQWWQLQYHYNGGELKLADVYSGDNQPLPVSLKQGQIVHENLPNPDGSSSGLGLYLDLNNSGYEFGKTKHLDVDLYQTINGEGYEIIQPIYISLPEPVKLTVFRNTSSEIVEDTSLSSTYGTKIIDIDIGFNGSGMAQPVSLTPGMTVRLNPFSQDGSWHQYGLYLDSGANVTADGQPHTLDYDVSLSDGYTSDEARGSVTLIPPPPSPPVHIILGTPLTPMWYLLENLGWSSPVKVADITVSGGTSPTLTSPVKGEFVAPNSQYTYQGTGWGVYVDPSVYDFHPKDANLIVVTGSDGTYTDTAMGSFTVTPPTAKHFSFTNKATLTWEDFYDKHTGEVRIADISQYGGTFAFTHQETPGFTVHNYVKPGATYSTLGLFADLSKFSFTPVITDSLAVDLTIADRYSDESHTLTLPISGPQDVKVALTSKADLSWHDFLTNDGSEIRLADVTIIGGKAPEANSLMAGESIHTYKSGTVDKLGLFLDPHSFSYVSGQTDSIHMKVEANDPFGHSSVEDDISIAPRPDSGVFIQMNHDVNFDRDRYVSGYREPDFWHVADAFMVGASPTDQTSMSVNYQGENDPYRLVRAVQDTSDHSLWRIYVAAGNLPTTSDAIKNLHVSTTDSTTGVSSDQVLPMHLVGQQEYWLAHGHPSPGIQGYYNDFYSPDIGYAKSGDAFGEFSNNPIAHYQFKMLDNSNGFFAFDGSRITAPGGMTLADQNKTFTIETTNEYGYRSVDKYAVHYGEYYGTYHDVVHV